MNFRVLLADDADRAGIAQRGHTTLVERELLAVNRIKSTEDATALLRARSMMPDGFEVVLISEMRR